MGADGVDLLAKLTETTRGVILHEVSANLKGKTELLKDFRDVRQEFVEGHTKAVVGGDEGRGIKHSLVWPAEECQFGAWDQGKGLTWLRSR